MVTQESLKYYIALSGYNPMTIVYLLGNVNIKTGKAKVKIIESGILDAKDGEIINDFQFLYGVLKFVQKDFCYRLN